MRKQFQMLLVILVAFSVTACGNKGRLKTPAEMAHDQEKAAQEQAKKEKKKQAAESKEVAPAAGEAQ